MFSTQTENCIPIRQYFDIISLFAAELEAPKIGMLGKGLCHKIIVPDDKNVITGPLAQLVERRTREHNVLGHYRCGFESPAGPLKLVNVFWMRR